VRLPFNGSFLITQFFGVNPQDYAQFGMKGHNGIDYGLPTGTPVVAAESGQVFVRSDPPGFGNYIELYSAGYRTIYAHLKEATVPNGSRVTVGQQIGISDNTGNSSGPHLHFGVKPINPDKNNGFLGAIDPQPILNQGVDMVPNQRYLQVQFQSLADRDPTDKEVLEWVGKKSCEELQDVLTSQQAYKDLMQARRVGQVAIRDHWQERLEAAEGEATELEPGIYRVP
jgi:hypothetical protein